MYEKEENGIHLAYIKLILNLYNGT